MAAADRGVSTFLPGERVKSVPNAVGGLLQQAFGGIGARWSVIPLMEAVADYLPGDPMLVGHNALEEDRRSSRQALFESPDRFPFGGVVPQTAALAGPGSSVVEVVPIPSAKWRLAGDGRRRGTGGVFFLGIGIAAVAALGRPA